LLCGRLMNPLLLSSTRLFVCGAVLVTACNGSDVSPPAAPASDPGAAPPVVDEPDAAPPVVVVPRPAAPQVVSAGGPVLTTPKLAVVTFDDEPFAAQLETYAKTIGATSYWKAVTSEYGVGPATFARSIKVANAPMTIRQEDIETWLRSQLDGTHPEWGAPGAGTIYTIVYPTTTRVTVQGGSACAGSPAWHGEVQLANKLSVPYAVIARCDPFVGLNGIDFVTAGLSHEWLEASTNPFNDTNPAWNAAAPTDAEWTTFTGGEVGDMCAVTPTVYIKPDGFPFMVQRSWSNASAKAGHDPCVPAPPEPYFNAAPIATDTVATGGIIDATAVHGIVIPVGGSRTIDVVLVGDGADGTTKPTFSVKATDYAQRMGAETDLKLSWNRQKGTSGETLQLTITRVKKDDALGGAAVFEIVSTLGKRESIWLGVVGDMAHDS
jgi:hypothetical protein